MNIVVYLRQAFAADSVGLHPVKGTLQKSDPVGFINPDDASALEVALRLKERAGGEVAAIMTGDGNADMLLREAIAAGADHGLLLPIADPEIQGEAVASALRDMKWDLILTGSEASDPMANLPAMQLAALLGIPQATRVDELSLENGGIVVRKCFRDSYQRLRIPLPALVAVMRGAAAYRGMHAAGVFQAFAEDKVRTLPPAKKDPGDMRMMSYEKSKRQRAGRIIRGSEAEIVKALVDTLRECDVLVAGGKDA